jgi:hypothetical protein
MKKDITEMFCFIDDFCKTVTDHVQQHQLNDKPHKKPTRVVD